MSFVKVKGTYDVLPNESRAWQALESHIRDLYRLYNYAEIRTPIMEYSEVIHRETEFSDTVTKETYNFKDKSDRDLTLRPEGTAGVIRSYIENKLYVDQEVVKLYYMGPNFRYERPQKGRFRQFMQFGVEAVGSNDPRLDAEVIALAHQTIESLGLKGVVVKVNSLGDDLSKENFKEALKNYLLPYEEQLSPDSKSRLVKNPLRILDSKDPSDQVIIKDAPRPVDFLTVEAKAHFDLVIHTLDLLKIPYVLDPKLVRGLDYYSHTVFEIQAEIEGFGAQNALGGGGRYQSLVKELGGPDQAGIGFAFGMERLLSALEIEGVKLTAEEALDVYFITFDDQAKNYAQPLLQSVRKAGLKAEMNYSMKSFKGQLKHALRLNAKFIAIIGEDEMKQSVVSLKNTKTEIQETVKMDELIHHLKELI